MTARTPVYIDSGKLHVFESGDTLPPWLSPSSMAWENLTGVPAGLSELAALTGPGYAKVDSAGAWSVQAAIPQADVSGLTTTLAGLQPISARLTAIAGLTDAAGWLHDDGAGNWSLTTPTKSDVGLGSVENTALSTWAGSANLTTLGTISTGTWHGTAIADSYIASAATWNAKEGGLGNPSVSGQVLASTTAGVRSWVSLPAASTTTPAALGIAAIGTGTTWARADHIHAMPTASQVGAEPALGSPSTSGYLLSSTSTGVRSWVAPYSLPTAAASVLGGVKVGTGLSISSGALSVSYGAAAGTACVGNDSRLSDSRTPTAHALDGSLHTISGKTAGQALVATSATTFGFATISGDATLSGTGALTLTSLLTAGSAGSATSVPTLTWDAKGRLTAVGSAAISIPHSQISDWGSYINQPLLTTSSPTFASATIANGVYRTYANDATVAAIYGYAVTPSGTNYALAWNQNGSGSYLNGITNSNLFVNNTAVLSATATGITAYQPITGNLTGTASNASALGGVAADYFVQGSNSSRTTLLTDTVTSQSQLTKSGFYSSSMWTDAPVASTWTHLIHSQYASDGGSANNWSFDIAANFGSAATPGSPEGYYIRAIANGISTGWRTLIHSANYPSFNNFTSGLSTTTLTASGLITANGGISGNLTGHASLDIPLTGSNAITGNLTPGNDALYDLGSGALQWNSIRGKTIYENGSQLANVYASLGSDNTYTGIQNTSGIVSDGNFFLRGFLSLNPDVITTNAARTIDVSMCNIVIYTVQQQYVQTLPDGTYFGQTLIVKNAQNVSGVTFGGKIATGATLVPERNTSIFVWNSNSNRWE